MLNSVLNLSLIIVFFPLIAAVLIFVNLSYWSPKKVQCVAVGSIFCSLVCSIYLLSIIYYTGGFVYHFSFGLWFSLSTPISWGFLIDELTVAMFFTVSLISLLVYLFSIDYMKTDININRFFTYLLLFSFFMLILVLGSNYLIMFVGWEGVGLCSYLLIGFWFKNTAYNDAAKKAFIMNRIGDLGFLLGIILILLKYLIVARQ